MVFSMTIELCNHHHFLVLEYFYCPERNSVNVFSFYFIFYFFMKSSGVETDFNFFFFLFFSRYFKLFFFLFFHGDLFFFFSRCVNVEQSLLWETRIYYPQICLFGIRIVLSWRQLRKSRCRKALCPPSFCLKTEYKFTKTKIHHLSFLPGRTKANHWRKL